MRGLFESALAKLPHREPFRFVTGLHALEPGENAVGWWEVTGEEAFFRGHFPDGPIVPGVLIAEALAQLAGLVGPQGGRGFEGGAQLASVDVKFVESATPPVRVEMRAKVERTVGRLSMYDVEAGLGAGGVVIAKGRVVLSAIAG